MTTEKKLITSAQTDRVADLGREAVKTAVGKVNPTSSNAQTGIISAGGEFKNRVEEAVKAIILDMTTPNKYENEVVSSNYTYPKEFVRKSEEEQIVILCQKVLKIDPRPVVEHLKKFMMPTVLPFGCHSQDGNFAILSPFGAQVLVPGYSDPFSSKLYCKTLLKFFEIIKSERNFINYRENQIDEQYLRQSIRTLDFYKTIGAIQGESPIWILSTQLGFLHKGKSVRRGREIFLGNEFGLGSVAMASIAETHPKRYVRWKELDTDCSGDEFAPDADGVFSEAPFLGLGDGKLEFDTNDVSCACDCFGSVSAFVSQN
jgi:hypothetical protein